MSMREVDEEQITSTRSAVGMAISAVDLLRATAQDPELRRLIGRAAGHLDDAFEVLIMVNTEARRQRQESP